MSETRPELRIMIAAAAAAAAAWPASAAATSMPGPAEAALLLGVVSLAPALLLAVVAVGLVAIVRPDLRRPQVLLPVALAAFVIVPATVVGVGFLLLLLFAG